MQLSRIQRKLILLYARLFELFERKEPIEGGCVDLDSSRCFIWKSERGGEIPIVNLKYIKEHRTAARSHDDAADLRTLNNVIPTIFTKGDWKPNPVSNHDQGVFSFGENIGIPRGRARYIIDQEFARQIPTFSFASQTYGEAQAFTSEFGGEYYLYRHDVNAVTRVKGYTPGLLIRATVSIRYPVPYSSRDAEGEMAQRVRCKINLPSYVDLPSSHKRWPTHLHWPVYKYDGYVIEQSSRRWHWLLQSRPAKGRAARDMDLLLIYTEPPDAYDEPGTAEDSLVLQGVIFTQNQEDELIPTASKIVLFRKKGVEVRQSDESAPGPRSIPKVSRPPYLSQYASMWPEDERAFMRGEPKVINLSNYRQWSARDARAIELLFSGAAPFNSSGLHDH